MQIKQAVSIENRTSNKFIIFLIISMMIFMNQSGVLFGINMSIADIFALLLFIKLLFKNKISISYGHFIFFIFVTIIVTIASFYVVPNKLVCKVPTLTIIVGVVKLFVSFMYFLIGLNLKKVYSYEQSFRFYSITAFNIGAAGIIVTLIGISEYVDFMYIGERFKGAVNDPNLFSLMQLCALVYFSRSSLLNSRRKIVGIIILVLSILLSSSKTGLIILLCYIIARLIESLFVKKRKLINTAITLVLISVIIGIISILPEIIQAIVNRMFLMIPTLDRVKVLFINFSSAITGSGSVRDATWKTAIEVIGFSPLIGVGGGTYSIVAQELAGDGVLAHNTYLQMAAEWGIIFSAVFFAYVVISTFKLTCNYKKVTSYDLIVRDIIVVFLIASMSISLNNVRLFCLMIGIITEVVRRNNTQVKKEKLEIKELIVTT